MTSFSYQVTSSFPPWHKVQLFWLTYIQRRKSNGRIHFFCSVIFCFLLKKNAKKQLTYVPTIPPRELLYYYHILQLAAQTQYYFETIICIFSFVLCFPFVWLTTLLHGLDISQNFCQQHFPVFYHFSKFVGYMKGSIAISATADKNGYTFILLRNASFTWGRLGIMILSHF